MFKLKKNLIAVLFAITASNAGIDDFVDIHGFVSQGFLLSNNNNFLAENSREGSLEMREMGINFQKEIGNKLRVGAQLLSRDVGVYGNNKVVLDWAYGEFILNDAFKISAGRVKNQLGLFTDVQDFDFLTPWALLPSFIYDKGLRSLSANSDGLKLSGYFAGLEYSFTYGIVDLGKESDVEAYGQVLGLDLSNSAIKNSLTWHLLWNAPIDGLKINYTLLYLNDIEYRDVPMGGPVTADVKSDIQWHFMGIQYQHDIFDVIAEYHLRYSKGETSVYNHPILGDFKQPADTSTRQGGYLGVNFKPTEWFNFGGYYQLYWHETHISDNADITDVHSISNTNKDAAITASFNILGNFVLKLEGHFVKGTALLSEELNPKGLKDRWQYGVAKLTYNF